MKKERLKIKKKNKPLFNRFKDALPFDKLNLLKFFTHRPIAKLLSLLGATFLSFYVAYQEESSKDFIVPLMIKNVPKELAVSDVAVNTVGVNLKGKKSVLFGISADSVNAKLNLADGKKGTQQYTVLLEHEIPKEIKVRFTPEKVAVTLEEMSTRWVKVEPSFVGVPPQGHIHAGYECSPSRIEVSGAQSILNEIDAVYTEPISLKTMIKTSMKLVNLKSIDNTEFGETRAAVTVKVIPERDTKVFNDLFPAILNFNEIDYEIENISQLRISKLVLQGPRSMIEEIDLADISIILDLSGISREGVFSNQNVIIDLPNELEMVRVEPSNFTVVVGRK